MLAMAGLTFLTDHPCVLWVLHACTYCSVPAEQAQAPPCEWQQHVYALLTLKHVVDGLHRLQHKAWYLHAHADGDGTVTARGSQVRNSCEAQSWMEHDVSL